MRLSAPLLLLHHRACRITLFTRPQCGLCAEAKQVLDRVRRARAFEAREVDISGTGADARAWRDLYGLDVPVIHLSKVEAGDEDPVSSGRAVKLRHRFTPEDVLRKMDQVEKGGD